MVGMERKRRTWQSVIVLTVFLNTAAMLAGAASGSVPVMRQRIGTHWKHIAGAIVFARTGALDGIAELLVTLDESGTYRELNTRMRERLAKTRAALLTLDLLLREQRREEAWAQRLTVERLCDQCHQEYQLIDIMRRMMDEYNQIADAFVRRNYERVIEGMHLL
jgi:hypothetical protein